MELPPEIVQLIRDFSRPVFQDYPLYNHMLRSVRVNQWPLLKEALEDTVRKELTKSLVQKYIFAYQDWIVHKHVMKQDSPKEESILYEQVVTRSKYLKQQLVRKQYREQQTFRELIIHLYGESRTLLDIRRELQKIGI